MKKHETLTTYKFYWGRITDCKGLASIHPLVKIGVTNLEKPPKSGINFTHMPGAML